MLTLRTTARSFSLGIMLSKPFGHLIGSGEQIREQ